MKYCHYSYIGEQKQSGDKTEMDAVEIFLLVGICVSGLILKTFYDRGKKALSIFPDINSVTIRYRDKTALGYSTKTWTTKIGGASRALDIVVTDEELWIRSFLLLAGITQQHDLVHRIPLHKIMGIKQEGSSIVLDFKNDKDEKKQVVINTRDREGFLKSLAP